VFPGSADHLLREKHIERRSRIKGILLREWYLMHYPMRRFHTYSFPTHHLGNKSNNNPGEKNASSPQKMMYPISPIRPFFSSVPLHFPFPISAPVPFPVTAPALSRLPVYLAHSPGPRPDAIYFVPAKVGVELQACTRPYSKVSEENCI
jgi:hypothetical protein